MTIHLCPPEGSGLTGCCQRTPFELPRSDRLTLDAELVTCRPDPCPHGITADDPAGPCGRCA